MKLEYYHSLPLKPPVLRPQNILQNKIYKYNKTYIYIKSHQSINQSIIYLDFNYTIFAPKVKSISQNMLNRSILNIYFFYIYFAFCLEIEYDKKCVFHTHYHSKIWDYFHVFENILLNLPRLHILLKYSRTVILWNITKMLSCCLKNISYQCWKQLCRLIFLSKY